LVRNVGGDVYESNHQVEQVMRPLYQPVAQLRVPGRLHLDDLAVERIDDLVTVALKALQGFFEIRGVYASLRLEALLHLLRRNDTCSDFFIEQRCGLLYDSRR
jgi:hypothetical protein